jgi:hypothetical protein
MSGVSEASMCYPENNEKCMKLYCQLATIKLTIKLCHVDTSVQSNMSELLDADVTADMNIVS